MPHGEIWVTSIRYGIIRLTALISDTGDIGSQFSAFGLMGNLDTITIRVAHRQVIT
jgi:hypothetical protein